MLLNDENGLSDYSGGFGEETVEGYPLKDINESSSTPSIVFEPPSSLADVKLKPKSFSDTISTAFSSFKSSSSLKSTYPPASWPSDGGKSDKSIMPIYMQSSERVVGGLLHSEFDLSSSEPEQEVKVNVKELFSKRLKKTEVIKVEPEMKTLGQSKKQAKGSKCVIIPFLHEELEHWLKQKPLTKVNFVEKLKVSIDTRKCKILSEDNLKSTAELSLPEEESVGDFTLNMENTGYGLFIECYSSFKDGDITHGSQLFSKLTKNFKVIEEQKTEFQCENLEYKEKSLHVFMENKNYVAYRANKTNELVQKHRGCISLNYQNDFVLDGNLFALMRHLIAIKYSGCFQCYAVTISGRLCRQVFCVDERQYIKINGHMVEAISLQKSAYDYGTKRKIEMTETYFLPTGYMAYHSWKHSPYIIHMDRILMTQQRKLNPCMELTWKSDCSLYSLFEFEKEYFQCMLKKYLDNYPEVTDLLNDYMISLLHEKPKFIVVFTCDYFEHA